MSSWNKLYAGGGTLPCVLKDDVTCTGDVKGEAGLGVGPRRGKGPMWWVRSCVCGGAEYVQTLRSEFLLFGGDVMNPFDKLMKAMQLFLQNNAQTYKCKILYFILWICNFLQG